MTAATITPWSTRCSPISISPRWSRSATACARPACWPASASRPAWSRAAAIPRSSRCSTRRTPPRPGWIPAASMIDGLGFVTVTIHNTSSGQGHETLVATVIGEVLQIDPDLIRVVRPDSLACLPSNSPVGSRMAIMLGGAAFHAAQKLKAKLTRIARASVRPRRGQGRLRLGRRHRSRQAASSSAGPRSSTSPIAIIICCRRAWSRGLRPRM